MMTESRFCAAIFDLDGVLVDTATYHYQAWKRLAAELGFAFSKDHNERLKGVSRMRSLEILLEVGGLSFREEEKQKLADRKNAWYVEAISHLDKSELLPGAEACLQALREAHVPIALGSASRNAPLILRGLGIEKAFDCVVDAATIPHAKPAPDVFLAAARGLDVPAPCCVVFEDALAGIEAAHRAGMYAIGIGRAEALPTADCIAENLAQVKLPTLFPALATFR